MEYTTRQTAEQSERISAPGFLDETYSELNELRCHLGDITHRLNEAGFYGPPEIANTKTDTPVENNVRSRIVDEVKNLRGIARMIDHQTRNIAG